MDVLRDLTAIFNSIVHFLLLAITITHGDISLRKRIGLPSVMHMYMLKQSQGVSKGTMKCSRSESLGEHT